MNRTQEVELTNMCFIYDENRILVEEKKGTKYTNGLVFPGGHIEQGESFRDAVDSLGRIGNYIKVDQRFFGTMIKMIGITYLAEFSSGICKDAGYQSIASQIEIFSKLTILAMGLPILQTLLEVMTGFLG